jgi:uncharacterized protein (TIGR02300 family)
MADIRWGRKHVCLACQAAFYDMRRTPIACPKCGVVHQPVAVLKSDGRPPRKRHPLPATAAVAPAAAERSSTDEADEDGELAVEDEDVDPDDTEADDAEGDEGEADEAEEAKEAKE